MLEGHYPVRVTVVLVDGWAPVGLIWLIFFLSMLWTALFTQSAAGSAQILNPRLVMNLQCKEKIGKISHIFKALGPKVKIRFYKRDLVQKRLDKSVFQIDLE